MTPDLTNAKKFKNVQLGREIFLSDLVILESGQFLYTAPKPLTLKMEEYLTDYVNKEWVSVPSTENPSD
jgi:hypothetical protein